MKKYLLSNRVRNAILLAILLQSVIFGIGLVVTGTFSGTANRPYKVMESQVSEKNSLLSGYMNNVLLLSNTMEKELGRMSDEEEIQNRLIDNLNQEKKKSLAGQMSLFALVSEEEKKAYEVRFPNVEEYTKEIKLGFEKEVLGIYLSGHPLEEYEEKWRKNISAVTADFMLDEETNAVKIKDNQSVVIGGIITEKTIKYTKQNKAMAFITVEDLFGTVEVIIFPRDYEKYSRYLNEDEKVFVAGHANVEEDKNGKLICEKIYSFDDTKRELWLQFATKESYEEKEKELYSRLYGSDGNDEIVIYIASPRAMKRLGQNYNIHINPELVGNLTEFLGEKNVKIVEKSIEKK